ncbi:MAG: LysM peptidoglycan-binding domain-containing protein [Bacillaceae bacterium]|nr:LysM peptidoglycan-binding domain-containing protein [Bacillaceae bacterium]
MRIQIFSGDTLWLFSQIFNVPLRLIIDSNPNVNPNSLMVGQTIRIPGYVEERYVIRPGDTLWRISQRQNIPLTRIQYKNRQINPYQLRPGQVILLPRKVIWRVVQGKQAYSYEDMMNDLNELRTIYPFIRTNTIGQSVMGKSIPEVTVGTGVKRVHANASFHANEWITTPIMMTFLNDYLIALTNNQPIRGLYVNPFYEQTFLSLVPMVNPDGVNLVQQGPPQEQPYRDLVLQINNGNTNFSNWKANIRGVDLNNQYPARWEIEKERKEQEPAPRDYPGEAPLTEPEAIAMAELTRRRDFRRALAFHTQGEVIFWGFLGLEPPESETIVNEFARVSGYRPIQYVDSYAGYKDWFIQEWRRPGFTVELGRGINPLPLTQFNEIYEESLGIFLANLYL